MRKIWSCAAIVVLALSPAEAIAQSRIHGTVLDSAQGTLLALVEVHVEGLNIVTLSNAAGQYVLSIPVGAHTLRFRKAGYHPVARPLRVVGPDPLQFDVTMQRLAQQLDSVNVVARARPRMWPPGFDERKKEGFGSFITDSMLRKLEHTTLSSAIESRDGRVRIRSELGRKMAAARRGGRATLGRGLSGGRELVCYMAIWMDGTLIWQPDEGSGGPLRPDTRNKPPDLDTWSVTGMEAIEIYTVAQVPSQYRSIGAGCGVILLWTRGRSEPEPFGERP